MIVITEILTYMVNKAIGGRKPRSWSMKRKLKNLCTVTRIRPIRDAGGLRAYVMLFRKRLKTPYKHTRRAADSFFVNKCSIGRAEELWRR
jgi:hypothetical protein